jgi:hypothetical protein
METHDLFPKFGHPQRMPTSPLRSSQRAKSLSTLILPRCHKDQLGSHYQSQQKGGQYKLLRTSPPSLGAPGQPKPSRDSISKSNKCNEVVEGEVEVLLLESGTLKRAQIFSQEQDSRVKLRKRGRELRN